MMWQSSLPAVETIALWPPLVTDRKWCGALAARSLAEAGVPARLMIDFSHGNSSKKPEKQVDVARDVADQIAGGESRIFGIMAESHLKAGRQDLLPGKELVYGMSITDGCIGWEDSRKVLGVLADAVSQRRLKAQRAE